MLQKLFKGRNYSRAQTLSYSSSKINKNTSKNSFCWSILTTVFERAVLEKDLLCNDWQIEIVVLSMLCMGKFGCFVTPDKWFCWLLHKGTNCGIPLEQRIWTNKRRTWKWVPSHCFFTFLSWHNTISICWNKNDQHAAVQISHKASVIFYTFSSYLIVPSFSVSI